MESLNEEDNGAREEITSTRPRNSRRERQQLRFSKEEEKEPKSPSTFKPPTRASRFMSICDPSQELPGASLLRLQQLHTQTANEGTSMSEGITDAVLDKMPFRIEIIPERRDDLDIVETRPKTKPTTGTSAVIPSRLTDQRRLQIIEDILKKLSKHNVLEEVRRVNAIPYRLPENNQMQKNVAKRIRELMGSDTVMLNDHIYMQNLCRRIEENHKKELELHFERLASNDRCRQLFGHLSS